MPQELLGTLGNPVLGEIARSAHDHEPEWIGETNLHHVALDGFGEPHAGVVAIGDDIDEAVLDDDLDVDTGVTRAEPGQHGRYDVRDSRMGHRKPEAAHGFPRPSSRLGDGREGLRHGRAGALDQLSPSVAQRHAAGRSGEQDDS